MSPPAPVHGSPGRRVTFRRVVALTVTLGAVSGLTALLGAAYVWPLFIFPLVLGAVFFFELGSLAVTFWLGNVLVLHYTFREAATSPVVRQALLGTVLFLLAGLLLGTMQRRNDAAQEKLAASSLTDRLTGLYNYGTFVDCLHTEIVKADRYGGGLCLLMLDLDHFKRFNDEHGHETGNELLRRVGLTLRAVVREADMPARYGGEEFAVLIRGDEGDGFELAERLRRAVEDIELEVRGQPLFTTISAGIAAYPGAGDENELVERADRALYESKRRGRNRVTIYAGARGEGEVVAGLSA